MTTRPGACSAFAGFYFPPDVIVLAVRWYQRTALSYRDVEELLADRGIDVDHVTIYRWTQRFTPLLAEADRPCRHAVGSTSAMVEGLRRSLPTAGEPAPTAHRAGP
jgi:transposase-like protein